jgi:hypothetical protein
MLQPQSPLKASKASMYMVWGCYFHSELFLGGASSGKSSGQPPLCSHRVTKVKADNAFIVGEMHAFPGYV